jgi:hypothetical protein
MMYRKFLSLLSLITCIGLASCDGPEPPDDAAGTLQLIDVKVGTSTLDLSNPANNTTAPNDKPVVATFSAALDQSSIENSVQLKNTASNEVLTLQFAYLNDDKTFSAMPAEALEPLVQYELVMPNTIRGKNGEKFAGHSVLFTTTPAQLTIQQLEINSISALNSNRITGIPLSGISIAITFSAPLDPSTITEQSVRVQTSGTISPLAFDLTGDNKTLTITTGSLRDLSRYQLYISDQLKGANQEFSVPFTRIFYTAESDVPKFPLLSDEELLTLVQRETFKYFWDFAHPVSGMARERNSSGDIVTTGGTGFGLMAILVGIERNFITRAEGIERLTKIADFLAAADRFHGAWPHWMNGSTGNVIPFSSNDNGGDLVETAFLVQGLLAVRQYLDPGVTSESELISKINTLWETVEWDWYTRGGQDVLYWHWSPTVEWAMNHQIRGHNETLITYVLAASSPTHPINASAYHQGYARNGSIVNGNTFYGTVLPLGEDYGGPLFFAHYSFMGLDPRNLSDPYANYWQQNVNHTLINRSYVIANPKNFVGYSDHNWGLTASDNQTGYAAHSPLNDLGVITPTAALSSFPYTPEFSMDALQFFYYGIGDRLWGSYGFKDAFNITENWYADSYLAIDQGPIIIMIENHRSALLWELFMTAPEVQAGLTKLGFTF